MYAALQVVRYIKGNSAIHLARVYGKHKRNFVGQYFRTRAILFPLSGGAKKRSGTTYETRNTGISDLTSETSTKLIRHLKGSQVYRACLRNRVSPLSVADKLEPGFSGGYLLYI